MLRLTAVQAAAGGYGGFDFNGADFGDIFGDIFGDLFGGGRRGGRANNGPMKGANIRKECPDHIRGSCIRMRERTGLVSERSMSESVTEQVQNREHLRRPVRNVVVKVR